MTLNLCTALLIITTSMLISGCKPAANSESSADPAVIVLVEPKISVSDISVNEGDVAIFTINLDHGYDQDVNFNWAIVSSTASISDFVDDSGTLTISAGLTSTTISVATQDDFVDEPTEVFILQLSQAIHATFSKSQGTASIIDNDAAASGPLTISSSLLTIADGNVLGVSASGGSPPYTFSVTAGPGSINTVTGAFFSAGTGAATIAVQDSDLTTDDIVITVNAAMINDKSQYNIITGETAQLTISGGVPPYNYEMVTGPGNINVTGLYSTGAFAGYSTARATDTIGNSFDVILKSVPPLPSGYILWFRADKLALADGASVTSWTDETSSVTLSAAGGNAPTFRKGAGRAGLDVVDFDGNDIMISGSSFVIAGDLSIYALLEPVSISGAKKVVISHGATGESSAENVNYQLYFQDNKVGMHWENGSGTNVSYLQSTVGDITEGLGFISIGKANTDRTWSGGGAVSSNISAFTPPNGGASGLLSIGGANDSAPDYYSGYISEIIIFPRYMPASPDFFQLLDYKNSRYIE